MDSWTSYSMLVSFHRFQSNYKWEPRAFFYQKSLAMEGSADVRDGQGNGDVYLLRTEHPQVHLTWGSAAPAKPDKLKLRKSVTVWPVKFTLKADYSTVTKEIDYGCTARVRSVHSVKTTTLQLLLRASVIVSSGVGAS